MMTLNEVPVAKVLLTISLGLLTTMTGLIKADMGEMKTDISDTQKDIRTLDRADAMQVQWMADVNRRLVDIEEQGDRIEEKLDNLRSGVAPGASDSEYQELRGDVNRILRHLNPPRRTVPSR